METDEYESENANIKFENFKIGGHSLDFELDDFAAYRAYNLNKARGQVGELPIGTHDISMQWKTGQASVLDQNSMTCTFDGSSCYQAKSVPVIFGMSANSGSKMGGLNLTITGYGFESG